MAEGWKSDKASRKQMEYIHAIENELGVSFTGTTKGEASDFIKSYKGDYENKRLERAERRFARELRREIRAVRRILFD